jgi:hypothetical protein
VEKCRRLLGEVKMSLRERHRHEQHIAHAEDTQANGRIPRRPDEEALDEKSTKIANGTATNGNTAHLPTYHTQLQQKTRGIQVEGESGRRGVHPWKFVKLIGRSVSTLSAATNILWPFVPAAIVLHFLHGEHNVWTFATSYIGMVPAAALLGFAGQEFSRKLPTVAGTLIESMFGSIVEIVLFMVLVRVDCTISAGEALTTTPRLQNTTRTHCQEKGISNTSFKLPYSDRFSPTCCCV